MMNPCTFEEIMPNIINWVMLICLGQLHHIKSRLDTGHWNSSVQIHIDTFISAVHKQLYIKRVTDVA